ncbi:hypothetical protein ANO11243_076110 [Dothideomycetidae sp. 11243]|nr:hypothetical protein ANO11243_076110 [fungal sp. No.11243]
MSLLDMHHRTDCQSDSNPDKSAHQVDDQAQMPVVIPGCITVGECYNYTIKSSVRTTGRRMTSSSSSSSTSAGWTLAPSTSLSASSTIETSSSPADSTSPRPTPSSTTVAPICTALATQVIETVFPPGYSDAGYTQSQTFTWERVVNTSGVVATNLPQPTTLVLNGTGDGSDALQSCAIAAGNANEVCASVNFFLSYNDTAADWVCVYYLDVESTVPAYANSTDLGCVLFYE